MKIMTALLLASLPFVSVAAQADDQVYAPCATYAQAGLAQDLSVSSSQITFDHNGLFGDADAYTEVDYFKVAGKPGTYYVVSEVYNSCHEVSRGQSN